MHEYQGATLRVPKDGLKEKKDGWFRKMVLKIQGRKF